MGSCVSTLALATLGDASLLAMAGNVAALSAHLDRHPKDVMGLYDGVSDNSTLMMNSKNAQRSKRRCSTRLSIGRRQRAKRTLPPCCGSEAPRSTPSTG